MRYNLILSTCGTSILTQNVPSEIRTLVYQYANAQKNEIEKRDFQKLSEHIEFCKRRLLNASIKEVPQYSAELNALVRFYNFQLDGHRDHHILLTTDTYLGIKTGEIIRQWLTQFQFSVDIINQKDLQTADLSRFQWALADLVKWINEYVSQFKEIGYHIVFNLTGGFKSVQGFLQTLAMLYADETIYVFETGKELFRLPRIPVKLVPQEIIEKNFQFFRKLELGIINQVPEWIPEVLLLKMGEEVILSDYGQIIFQQTKRELYEQKIWPSPYEKLIFSPEFLKSTEQLEPKRKRIINERIDDIINYLLTGKHINRLDFKQLKGNPKPPSTHEIDAWADQNAKRIYGHWEGNIFVLDKLDKALH